MTARIDAVEQLGEAVRTAPRVLPVGASTKPGLSTPADDGVLRLDVRGLRGIEEYDPAELTITALAGTPFADLQSALAEHGQYLPFDPPRAAAGATLGGIVATGASGPGAFRHGGIRDFLIGVRFVDGRGRLVAGGGRVVKNAAGFDLSKLMIGSMGRLGVLVGLSFKVFPKPAAHLTLAFAFGTLVEALPAVGDLARSPVTIDALDVLPGGLLLVRLGGDAADLRRRGEVIAGIAGRRPRILTDEEDGEVWADPTAVPPGHASVRIATPVGRLPALEDAVVGLGGSLRVGLGGGVAWVTWPAASSLPELDEALLALGLTGQALDGPPLGRVLGAPTGGAFGARIVRAIDPTDRFAGVQT